MEAGVCKFNEVSARRPLPGCWDSLIERERATNKGRFRFPITKKGRLCILDRVCQVV